MQIPNIIYVPHVKGFKIKKSDNERTNLEIPSKQIHRIIKK